MLPFLEEPEQYVTPAQEHQRQAQPVGFAGLEQRIGLEPESDGAKDHAPAQVGPRALAAYRPCLLIQRRRDRGPRTGGRSRRSDSTLPRSRSAAMNSW